MLAVVLDLLTALLDLAEAYRGRRALEEVPQIGELLKVSTVASRGNITVRAQKNPAIFFFFETKREGLWPGCMKEKERRERFAQAHSQLLLHFLEGGFGLVEEPLDYAAAECLFIVALIHLKDLLESRLVDVIAINNRWT